MPIDIFVQPAPRLDNTYRDDAFLQAVLARLLPQGMREEIAPALDELGALAARTLYELQLEDRLNEPQLTQWDAWGNRIDRIELTRVWKTVAPLAARSGLIAIPYERAHGALSRIHQFALLYLFHPASDLYTCPLAMTDGAARALVVSGNRHLIDRALPHLTSRAPASAWTSGQWMTEPTGGSDVGLTRTSAIAQSDGTWQLFGKKWFTSATTSEMALTLARPQGNGPGGSGLAMFYVETRDAHGRLNGIRIERLKDKLGTRKVPTAELLLDGTRAELVGEPHNGTRAIEPMLVVTRAWNSVSAAANMRRGMALANAYARERLAFGKRLSEQPLHLDTLDGLEAEARGACVLTFEFARLLGRLETAELDDDERSYLRLLTPIAKLTTAKQAVSVTSEVIESFGGAGYVEDTGLPTLLRDSQVLPIWEGTTNVLALDALLRGDLDVGLRSLRRRVAQCVEGVRDARLARACAVALSALDRAARWSAGVKDAAQLQAGARRLTLTIGRALELALLIEQAQWQLRQGTAERDIAMVARFARSQIALIDDEE